jgi:hypothetical protein
MSLFSALLKKVDTEVQKPPPPHWLAGSAACRPYLIYSYFVNNNSKDVTFNIILDHVHIA